MHTAQERGDLPLIEIEVIRLRGVGAGKVGIIISNYGL